MECVIGIVGKDFVLVASDTNQAHSIVIMKQGGFLSEILKILVFQIFFYSLR